MTKMPTNHALAPKRSNRDYGQPCMPRLLFRHIVFDLLRVQFLTASVLVAVIAFGAAIRPIMHNLLGPEEVLQFVALASVPMLQYALPFAGAFASTIVYARLAADNEVLAMSAAGMSYARVLRPAIGLGLALFLAMSVLLDAGVPRFWTSMRRMITNDVTRLFVSAVERGEAFAGDGTQLYADEVRVIEGTTDGSGPTTRLQLAGVAAIETGADGRTTTEFTAEFATVDVYRANDSAYLKLLFTKATVFRAGEDALVFVPQAEPEAIDLGKGIRLDPKDHSLTGLLALWNDVDSYHKVADARKEVENALTTLDGWLCVNQSLPSGTLRMSDPAGVRTYEIRNARLEGTRLLPLKGETLELIELDRGVASRRVTVKEATLTAEPAGRDAVARFELLARSDAVTEQASQRGSGRWPARIVGLAPLGCPAGDRSALSTVELAGQALAVAELSPEPGTPLAVAASAAQAAGARMTQSVRLVRADIVARITQRINQALCAPLMLVLGAVLAIRLRGANPLQVYVLAFLPSILDIMLISGGEQMLKGGTSVLGIVVCCSGNLMIFATIWVAYRRIARN